MAVFAAYPDMRMPAPGIVKERAAIEQPQPNPTLSRRITKAAGRSPPTRMGAKSSISIAIVQLLAQPVHIGGDYLTKGDAP